MAHAEETPLLERVSREKEDAPFPINDDKDVTAGEGTFEPVSPFLTTRQRSASLPSLADLSAVTDSAYVTMMLQ
jgi:hypothetical protein